MLVHAINVPKIPKPKPHFCSPSSSHPISALVHLHPCTPFSTLQIAGPFQKMHAPQYCSLQITPQKRSLMLQSLNVCISKHYGQHHPPTFTWSWQIKHCNSRNSPQNKPHKPNKFRVMACKQFKGINLEQPYFFHKLQVQKYSRNWTTFWLLGDDIQCLQNKKPNKKLTKIMFQTLHLFKLQARGMYWNDRSANIQQGEDQLLHKFKVELCSMAKSS